MLESPTSHTRRSCASRPSTHASLNCSIRPSKAPKLQSLAMLGSYRRYFSCRADGFSFSKQEWLLLLLPRTHSLYCTARVCRPATSPSRHQPGASHRPFFHPIPLSPSKRNVLSIGTSFPAGTGAPPLVLRGASAGSCAKPASGSSLATTSPGAPAKSCGIGRRGSPSAAAGPRASAGTVTIGACGGWAGASTGSASSKCVLAAVCGTSSRHFSASTRPAWTLRPRRAAPSASCRPCSHPSAETSSATAARAAPTPISTSHTTERPPPPVPPEPGPGPAPPPPPSSAPFRGSITAPFLGTPLLALRDGDRSPRSARDPVTRPSRTRR